MHRNSTCPWIQTVLNRLYISVIKKTITIWLQPIWMKMKRWWQILSQHQSTYLRGPESVSIESPRSEQNLLSKSISECECCEVRFTSIKNSFWKVYEMRSEREDADSGPLRHVLWWCGSICHQYFTFILTILRYIGILYFYSKY